MPISWFPARPRFLVAFETESRGVVNVPMSLLSKGQRDLGGCPIVGAVFRAVGA